MRTPLAPVAVALLGLCLAAPARAADPITHEVVPSVTDAAILDTTPTRGNHLVWVPPKARQVGKLLVFLPTGGPTNIPSEFTEFATVAARLGYHTLILAYRNEAPIAALPTAPVPGCGPDEFPVPVGSTCARDARMEILDGREESPILNVNRANSIENRLNRLLVHLKTTFPDEGWAQFVEPDETPKWSQTVIAGSSLGAGEAAMIAERHDVFRAVLLHGWVDASHGWVKRDATPSADYFTLIHARDNFFRRTCPAYKELGLTPSCPLPACPVATVESDPNPALFENKQPPFGTQMFVFNLTPGATDGGGDIFHQSTSRNHWIAKEADGVTPSHILVNAWRMVLGDGDADGYLDLADNCPRAANPSQADTDKNGIGDACPQGPVGGTVPATLALTLAPAATFGPFTPGVARTYAASASASVITTAGDAQLTVSDPGHMTNGAFSLPEPLQVAFSKATWNAPASNDPVTITFKQAIKATDALRTGAYTKSLTFTLSTTTP